ncbi:MAG: bifunctional 3,4-dihydroxy-2-butanone-4-phosphate synthase/GTP cyclohydrolase II [Bacteroidetes bacterium]|jgi:3,4-dihydroxy 2-butanone 4-phosphate synthase/GTP cyclohydrolase II|nr:bifunctional 3,4-dihydroxy-2-butanone-4-phosphate synthase/GTP cyclohydrolase II [Bacteroidota bacterium]MBK9320353.1 bifunctional 3,4-dihydroxy-2-butanone-4-phosphate synthase/GTP cyclohydrolase II [Bacteroidota bacterium]
MEIRLNSIEEAITAIKEGKIIIVVDDADRENEGDFLIASQFVTPEVVNFMATYGRGLICVGLTEERCEELQLPMMVNKNTASHETAFTVSVDLLGHGCTTGISASDRSKTIQALINGDTKPDDLARPGHIFPLRAKSGGVLRRAGHTEAAVDIASIAGLQPSATIVEIMNEDGSMARLPELLILAEKYGMKIVSIEDLIKYRLEKESLIERMVSVHMPTTFGDFDLIAYRHIETGQEHLALRKGEWTKDEPILVRVHSSCITGDIFGSCRCDCGPQLHKAMEMIEKEGKGVILYMNQEGRGIGLLNKLRAYNLQEQGFDTVEANLKLGFKMDERDYGVGAQILRDLGITKMKLLTNNPTKRAGLIGYGLEIVDRIPIEITPNPHNQRYLETKRDKMGHTIKA